MCYFIDTDKSTAGKKQPPRNPAMPLPSPELDTPGANFCMKAFTGSLLCLLTFDFLNENYLAQINKVPIFIS